MPEWFQPVSGAFIALIAAIFVAVLVWTIIVIPRLKVRRLWLATVRQGVSVMMSMAVCLLLVALLLNREEGWYPTWAALAGHNQVTNVQNEGAGLATATPQPPEREQFTKLQRDTKANPLLAKVTLNPEGKGTYLSTSVTGTASGLTGRVVVWLPPSYSEHPERAYPVIMMLNGYPGTVDVYRKKLQVGDVMVHQVADRRIREAIIVVPETNFQGVDTECVDSKDGHYKVNSFLAIDVVHWIKTNFRTVEHRDGWATLGYSAGGWCASMLSMRHPQQFRFSLNLSGYFKPIFPKNAPLQVTDPNAYDLVKVAQRKAPPVAIWYWAAKDDSASMKALREFTPHVKAPTTLVTTLLNHGGHSWPTWQQGLPAGLTWLGDHSPEFAWVHP